jgi:hypothetical protein
MMMRNFRLEPSFPSKSVLLRNNKKYFPRHFLSPLFLLPISISTIFFLTQKKTSKMTSKERDEVSFSYRSCLMIIENS